MSHSLVLHCLNLRPLLKNNNGQRSVLSALFEKLMENTSSWSVCNPDSIYKLQIECIEEEDGDSMVIQIDWDITDPDLQWWTDLGQSGQETFIIEALQKAVDRYVD